MKNSIKYLALIICVTLGLNLKANNPKLPKGIIYQIEIPSTEFNTSKQVISKYYYLRKLKSQHKIKYQFGKFISFNDANTVKLLLCKAGCKNAKIIAFNDKETIAVAQAISIQYTHQIILSKVLSNTKNIEKDYLNQVKNAGLNHHFSLAIPLNSLEMLDKVLEKIGNTQIVAMSANNNIYKIGNFNSYQEAIAAKQQIVKTNTHLFILAEVNDSKIPKNDANNIASIIQKVVNQLASK